MERTDPYWIVQVIGGFAGAAVLYVIRLGRAKLHAAVSPRTGTVAFVPGHYKLAVLPRRRHRPDRGLLSYIWAPRRKPRRRLCADRDRIGLTLISLDSRFP